jgi:hypothetical protein
VRIAPAVLAHLDELEDLSHARPDVALRQPPHLEREGKVLEHCHVRPDRVRLEHDSEVPPLGGDVDALPGVEERRAGDGDTSLVRTLESCDRQQRRRFAAAART